MVMLRVAIISVGDAINKEFGSNCQHSAVENLHNVIRYIRVRREWLVMLIRGRLDLVDMEERGGSTCTAEGGTSREAGLNSFLLG